MAEGVVSDRQLARNIPSGLLWGKKLFKSKLDKFLVKREALFLILLIAADIAFLGENRWLVLLGLFAGALSFTGRLGVTEWILIKTFRMNGRNAAAERIAAFTVSQLVWVPALVLAYLLSRWVLYGFVAGVLVVPVIIMMNSITEAFGITENDFE